MGWDITYHPFAASDIAEVYFAGVENSGLVSDIAKRFNVPKCHHENLADAFATGKDADMNGPFATHHGMNMAIVAGYLRPYWYVRGGAISFLADDSDFTVYFSDFRDLVPEAYKGLTFANRLTQNYCCGVYMTTDALRRLTDAVERDSIIRQKMLDLFSHGRYEVFKAAADHAVREGLGLLEAAEVIEPNPLNLNQSVCRSNLHNCDTAGVLLYRKAAMEQIFAASDHTGAASKPEAEPQKKRGFFSRLFGKG